MKIACIGSGYVGSVTAAAFAALGHDTTVIDTDPVKVADINNGKSPIYEPGLDLLIAELAGGNLKADTSYLKAGQADVIFICVGTPSRDDGTADLRWVKQAAESIAGVLDRERNAVIVNKSTVPVGTAELVSGIIEQTSGLAAGEHFSVVSNPEFLREGFALQDVFFPDRIVVGSENSCSAEVMRELYKDVLTRNLPERILNITVNPPKPAPVYFETDTKCAELIKYVSNAFLAVKISYVNETARLCDALGADVREVMKGMGLDSRIGSQFLQVSPGWSGSCFPKDTKELLATGRRYGQKLEIVKAAVRSNEKMHQYCIERLQRRLKSLNGKKIGVLGLTFKPDTDDARISQAAYIIGRLAELGARVCAYDPKGMAHFQELHGNLPVEYGRSGEATADRADGILLLTHWREFLSLPWNQMKPAMKQPYVLDTRNFLDGEMLRGLGYEYEGMGIYK